MTKAPLVCVAAAVALCGACQAVLQPALVDFTDDKAEVRVPYYIQGPNIQDARDASSPVANEHCRTLGKTTTYISARRIPFDTYTGEYVFLFRCEGADTVRIEDR